MTKRKADDDEFEQHQKPGGSKHVRLVKLHVVNLPTEMLRQILGFLALEDSIFRVGRASKNFQNQVTLHCTQRPASTLTWHLHFNTNLNRRVIYPAERLLSALKAVPNLLANTQALDFSNMIARNSLRLPRFLQVLSQCYTTLETLVLPQPTRESGSDGAGVFADAVGLQPTDILDLLDIGIARQATDLSGALASSLGGASDQKDVVVSATAGKRKVALQEKLQRSIKLQREFRTDTELQLQKLTRILFHPQAPLEIDVNKELMMWAITKCTNLKRLVCSTLFTVDRELPVLTHLWGAASIRSNFASLTELHVTIHGEEDELEPFMRVLAAPENKIPLQHLVITGGHIQNDPAKLDMPQIPLDLCKQFSKSVGRNLHTFVLTNFQWRTSKNRNGAVYQDSCAKLRAIVADMTELRQFGMLLYVAGLGPGATFEHWTTEMHDCLKDVAEAAGAEEQKQDLKDSLCKIFSTVLQNNNKHLHTLSGLGYFFAARNTLSKYFPGEYSSSIPVTGMVKRMQRIPLLARDVLRLPALRRLIILMGSDSVPGAPSWEIMMELLRQAGRKDVQLLYEEVDGQRWTTWTTYRPEGPLRPPMEHQKVELFLKKAPRHYADTIVRSWPWLYGEYVINVEYDWVGGRAFVDHVFDLISLNVVRPIAHIPGPTTASPWRILYQHPALDWDSKLEQMTVRGQQVIPKGARLLTETGMFSDKSTNVDDAIVQVRLITMWLVHGGPPADMTGDSPDEKVDDAWMPFFTQFTLDQWNAAGRRIRKHWMLKLGPAEGTKMVGLFPLVCMRLPRPTAGNNHKQPNVKMVTSKILGESPFAYECALVAAEDLHPGTQLFRYLYCDMVEFGG